MSAPTSTSTERRARRWLHTLHRQVGMDGLAAAAQLPGLHAAIDQHAAAVRDATTLGLQTSPAAAGFRLLANYAQGVLDHARSYGWAPPDPGSWPTADWVSVRLVAVCALARAGGPRRRPTPPPLNPPAPA